MRKKSIFFLCRNKQKRFIHNAYVYDCVFPCIKMLWLLCVSVNFRVLAVYPDLSLYKGNLNIEIYVSLYGNKQI